MSDSLHYSCLEYRERSRGVDNLFDLARQEQEALLSLLRNNPEKIRSDLIPYDGTCRYRMGQGEKKGFHLCSQCHSWGRLNKRGEDKFVIQSGRYCGRTVELVRSCTPLQGEIRVIPPRTVIIEGSLLHHYLISLLLEERHVLHIYHAYACGTTSYLLQEESIISPPTDRAEINSLWKQLLLWSLRKRAIGLFHVSISPALFRYKREGLAYRYQEYQVEGSVTLLLSQFSEAILIGPQYTYRRAGRQERRGGRLYKETENTLILNGGEEETIHLLLQQDKRDWAAVIEAYLLIQAFATWIGPSFTLPIDFASANLRGMELRKDIVESLLTLSEKI